ncbi:unnamed protein product [Choristocarpus tenellus]
MVVLYGYDFGITAWVIVGVNSAAKQQVSHVYGFLHNNSVVFGILVASVSMGGVIGAMMSHKVGLDNVFGRRKQLRFVCLLCGCGGLMEALTGLHVWDNTLYLVPYVVGR